MNDGLKMQISAFVDGELPDNECELLLRRLSHDVDLRQQVARYLEIGRCMRRESELPGMPSLRNRIAQSLGEEVYVAEAVAHPQKNRLVKPLAGFAIAASVAMLAIFSLQQIGDPAESEVVAPQVAESDAMLDEMFRHHESEFGGVGNGGFIGELVDLEINEADLVRVEPKAELISTVEFQIEVNNDDSVDATPEDVRENSGNGPAE